MLGTEKSLHTPPLFIDSHLYTLRERGSFYVYRGEYIYE